MTQEKTPAATEVTTSAGGMPAIIADQDNGHKPTRAGGKPKRDERRKTRDRKRNPYPDRSLACNNRGKPKGPVRRNTLGKAVAGPTVKRAFVMPDFVRAGFSRYGMVYGHGGGYPQGRPHGFTRVSNHHAHPLRVETRLVDSESRKGVPTMTQAVNLVRTAAPIISLASRRAAPIQSPTDTTNPEIIRLHVAAENALAGALHLLRSLDCDPAKLQQATGRAIRASSLLKRACAASLEGGAA